MQKRKREESFETSGNSDGGRRVEGLAMAALDRLGSICRGFHIYGEPSRFLSFSHVATLDHAKVPPICRIAISLSRSLT